LVGIERGEVPLSSANAAILRKPLTMIADQPTRAAVSQLMLVNGAGANASDAVARAIVQLAKDGGLVAALEADGVEGNAELVVRTADRTSDAGRADLAVVLASNATYDAEALTRVGDELERKGARVAGVILCP
jgi:hypothetical protein